MAIGHQFSLVVVVVGIHGVFISVCMYLYDACKYLLASLEYSSVFFLLIYLLGMLPTVTCALHSCKQRAKREQSHTTCDLE